jgi:NAD(P)-dependent dehydrogenase (short-subunit alcohol dehydrogenase family)
MSKVALVTGSSSGIGAAVARGLAAEDALRAAQGYVINISSLAAVKPTGSSIPYSGEVIVLAGGLGLLL